MFQPNLGRWMQLDPIHFVAGDVNLYRPIGNNVLNALDPTGFEEIELTDDGQIDSFGWSYWRSPIPDGADNNKAGALTLGTIVPRFEDQTKRTEVRNKNNQMSVFYTATLKCGVTWVAKFWPEKSWATSAARVGDVILKHERIHLKIARYIAELATKQIPLTNLKASAGDDGNARINLSAKIKSVQDKLLFLVQKVQDGGKDTAAPYELGYDAETNHGLLKGPQGDWQRDYKTKVNTALNKLDEWKELIEYASGLSK